MSGKILWGAASSGGHYENELTFGYGFFDPVTDRVPREGSAWIQVPSGVEDSWITGRDYTLTIQARLIPDSESTAGGADGPQRTGLSGPAAWQEVFDYARAKNDFRFVPNTAYPDHYVDTCYLTDPLRGFGGNNPILQRDVPLTIRSKNADFHQALRGVAFEYRPGGLTTGSGNDPTFSRSGPANSVGHALGIVQSSSGVLRDRNYESTGLLRTTLLEGARTNLALRSEDFAASTVWASIGTPTLTSGAYTGLGDVTLDLIGDDSTAVLEGREQIVTFSTDGRQGVSLFFRQDNSTGFLVDLFDNTLATYRLEVAIDLTTAGIATVAATTLGTLQRLRALGDRSYRLELVTTTGLVAASCNYVRVFPATTARNGGNTGRIYAGGVQCEPSFVTSYLKSVSTAATRNAESLSWSLPTGFQKPQASWWYVRFVELGTLGLASNVRIFDLASSAAASPKSLMYAPTTTVYRFGHDPTSTGGVVTDIAVAPAFGDTVELLGLIFSDGSIQLRSSINGGAESNSTQTAAPAVRAFASSWSDSKLWLNGVPSVEGVAGFVNVKCGPGTTVSTIALARAK